MNSNSTRFAGKTALISGAASGQGACEARLLVEQGGSVVIGDIMVERGEALARDLGDRAHFVKLDVRKEDEWKNAVAVAQEKFGALQLLVNNAGVLKFTPIETETEEEFTRQMAVNQLGVFLGMKTAFPALRSAGGGSIVNISSIGSYRGSVGAVAYSGTKWAVRGMTKVAANEFGPHNIRVNSVHPGFLATDLVSFVTPDMIEGFRHQLPMQKHMEIADVANAVLFLLSDEAKMITAAELKVDAGLIH